MRSIPAAFNYIEVHQHLRPRSRFLSRSEEITLLAEEREERGETEEKGETEERERWLTILLCEGERKSFLDSLEECSCDRGLDQSLAMQRSEEVDTESDALWWESLQ